MNFFEYQDQARKSTRYLVFLYLAAVAVIIAAVYFSVILVLSGSMGSSSAPPIDWWNRDVFTGTTLSILFVVLSGTLYKIMQLRKGGSIVALTLGGRRIFPNTDDPEERKLMNVVEEMAIASGVPVPPVYVMDKEEGINAFAAGFSIEDAAISVTRGCLTVLSRDELQGVIAHEFSHILNGDMRLSLRLIGVLNGIMVLSMIGQTLLRGSYYAGTSYSLRRRRSSSGGGILFLALVLVVVGSIGVFFARIIKSAISRQREYLADASGVQFTRYPAGLAGALKKIGGLSTHSAVKHPRAEEVSHMFFADAMTSKLSSLLDTHPALPDRIRRLEPDFNGEFPPVLASSRGEREAADTEPLTSRLSGRGRGVCVSEKASPEKRPAVADLGDHVTESVGSVKPEHIRYAEKLIPEIPGFLYESAQDPIGARALIYSLLINEGDPETEEAQTRRLFTYGNNWVFQQTRKIRAAIADLNPEMRFPLVQLAIPAIREISPQQYSMFRENLRALINADGKIEPFEFALQQVILHQLDHEFAAVKTNPRTRHYQTEDVLEDCRELFLFLAFIGHDSENAAALAYHSAMKVMDDTKEHIYKPPSAFDAEMAEKALKEIAQASPAIKKLFIKACVTAVVSDGRVTCEESEMIRAFGAVLNCPIPPLVFEGGESRGAEN